MAFHPASLTSLAPHCVECLRDVVEVTECVSREQSAEWVHMGGVRTFLSFLVSLWQMFRACLD